MENLIKLFSKMQYHKQSMELEITYDKVADWVVYFVWKDKKITLESQSISITLACADMLQKLVNLCIEDDDIDLNNIPYNILL